MRTKRGIYKWWRFEKNPADCAHDKGMMREYIAGMNTGDDQCTVCGKAMSPRMWAELREAQATIKRLADD
jgi:hypothetical protein